MTKTFYFTVSAVILLMAAGCSMLQSGYEKPVVTITSFEAVPSQNLSPRFQIGLHIINPNRTVLDLVGISYSISLEGHKIMTGVSNQLPRIEPYGEGDVVLNAAVNLFSSIVFFTDLIRDKKTDQLEYSLNAKLDAGSFHPLIRLSKKGILSLDPPEQEQ